MENVTWLQTLGLAIGTGLISLVGWMLRQVLKGELVPRATLQREREISNQWREAAETYAENDKRRSEIMSRNNEMMARVLSILAQAPWLGTDLRDGLSGFPGSGESEESRTWQQGRHGRPY